MNDAQREEIRRLHRVCRAKDETIEELIQVASELLSKAWFGDRMTNETTEHYTELLKEFEGRKG